MKMGDIIIRIKTSEPAECFTDGMKYVAAMRTRLGLSWGSIIECELLGVVNEKNQALIGHVRDKLSKTRIEKLKRR